MAEYSPRLKARLQYFGTQLTTRRKALGLTQNQLARRLDVEGGGGVISTWEKGARPPSLDKLLVMVDFFGTSIDEMLGLMPPRTVVSGNALFCAWDNSVVFLGLPEGERFETWLARILREHQPPPSTEDTESPLHP